jgi:hypothetical protein
MTGQYIKLRVGDVRRKEDEVRHIALSLPPNKPFGKVGYINHPTYLGEWEPVKLVGHKILASDLMAAEFARSIR